MRPVGRRQHPLQRGVGSRLCLGCGIGFFGSVFCHDRPSRVFAGLCLALTDNEHATIGRIAILWGQVEFFVEELLPEISGLTTEQLTAILIMDKPIAQKVSFLKASARRHSHAETGAQVETLCTLIEETKVQRNHLFHGMWGWRAHSERVFPAARRRSEPHAPLPASSLAALEKKLCKCSRLGFDLVTRVAYGELGRPHPSRFLHHSAPKEPPEWLLQWSARNPWDDGDPDRIDKAGQLPRRSRLYPERYFPGWGTVLTSFLPHTTRSMLTQVYSCQSSGSHPQMAQ